MQVIIVVWQFMMYGGWSMVYFLARSSSEGAARKQKLKEGEAKRQEAELEMLRSQINPHFLFNAMNTIASESDGNPRIGKIVDGLSDFLRYSLSSRGKSLVPFGDELHATCQYLEVEKARYGESLKVNLDIEPSTSKVLLPGVLLQPLVENAIKHGRESSEDQLIIDLVATYDGEDFEIVVSNTGIWNPEILEHRELHTGVGLPNIQQRLELSYQGRSSFQIGPIANRVVATIRINHPETSLPDG
jgi:LytS/YehU family sensor histidine kinase